MVLVVNRFVEAVFSGNFLYLLPSKFFRLIFYYNLKYVTFFMRYWEKSKKNEFSRVDNDWLTSESEFCLQTNCK